MVSSLSYAVLFLLLALRCAASAAPLQPPSPNQETGLLHNASAPTVTEVSGGTSSPFEVSPTVGFMGASALIGARASMNYFPVSLELAVEQVIGRTATPAQ